MFGIKTKKDRTIEKQFKRIAELERQLIWVNHPMYVEHTNVRKVCASQTLLDDMPVEYAKRHIARLMAEQMMNSEIRYEIEDDSHGRKIVTGYLRVVHDTWGGGDTHGSHE